jgi:HSP20 family protein
MTTVRWEPLRELTSLQADMNRLFNTAFAGPVAGARRWSPPLDLIEKSEGYVLRVDLPGVGQDDLALQVEDNVLTLSGTRKQETEEGAAAYHHSERSFGAFSRAISLPKGVDAEAVTASFTNGVLEVAIPKPEQAKPRRIQIGVTTPQQEAIAA